MKSLTLFLILGLLSCSTGGLSEGEILAQAPVVHRAEGKPAGPRKKGLPEDEANRLLTRARDAFLREDYDTCLKTIRSALDAGVPADVGTKMRSLKFRARRRLFSRRVLAVRVLPERDVVVMGKKARVDLVLRNVSDVEVRVPRTVRGSSPSVFYLEVTREDRDIFGNVRSESNRVLVRLPFDIDLAPGSRKAIPFSAPTPDPATRHRGFTRLTFRGEFRPAAIEAGKHGIYATIRLVPGEVRVVPPGYQPLARAPVKSLAQSFSLGAREHLLVAAALVAPEDVRRATGRLVSFLDRANRPMSVTVMAALRFLTGRSFSGRPEGWQTWWKEEVGNGASGN